MRYAKMKYVLFNRRWVMQLNYASPMNNCFLMVHILTSRYIINVSKVLIWDKRRNGRNKIFCLHEWTYIKSRTQIPQLIKLLLPKNERLLSKQHNYPNVLISKLMVISMQITFEEKQTQSFLSVGDGNFSHNWAITSYVRKKTISYISLIR